MMRTIVAVFLVVAGCAKRDTAKPSHNDDGWSAVGIGSVFETKTVTRLEQPFAHQTETTTKQTLVATNATEASVKISMSSAGAETATHEVKVPLKAKQTYGHAPVTTADETCIVPAGTFDCTKTTVEVRDGAVTRSTVTWTAKTIPIPIKQVVTNENMTTTTELTRVALAR